MSGRRISLIWPWAADRIRTDGGGRLFTVHLTCRRSQRWRTMVMPLTSTARARGRTRSPLLLLVVVASLEAQEPRARKPTRTPTLILTDGKIFTADSTRPWAEAIAIRGERIVAIGTTAEVSALAGHSTQRIDLGGRVVVPGFNDSHVHMGCGGITGADVATGAGPTSDPPWQQVADSLAASVKRAVPGTWISAVISSSVLQDTGARRTALDRIAPQHPVLLSSWTGHGTIFNSAALRLLGINDTAADPLGGRFEREPSTHRLTGLAEEYAQFNAARERCSLAPESTHVRALQAHGQLLLRLGITSVQDMASHHDPALTLRIFKAAALPQRVRIIAWPGTTVGGRLVGGWDDARAALRTRPDTTGRVVVSGVKYVLDGTPVERLAVQRAAYTDRPGWFGRLNFPPDTIRVMLGEARARDQQPMFHAVGDSTVAVVLTMMEQTGGAAIWRPRRVRIEHGDGLARDLRARARRLGVVVVQNPGHFALAGLAERFGAGVHADYQPVRSLLTEGIPLAFGSDGPLSPFVNILLATNDANNPKESLTREQAVVAYTRGSAYAEFAERQKGVLAAGMLADLAVLSQDIFSVQAGALPATTSVLTLVGGRIVYDDMRKSASLR